MNAQTIIETLETQPILYRKSADFTRYVVLSKTELSLELAPDGDQTRGEKLSVWNSDSDGGPWVASQSVIMSEDMLKNFSGFLDFWIEMHTRRHWGDVAPYLGEVVRAVHTWAYHGGYKVYLVNVDKPLSQAEPWEVPMESMDEIQLYDN